MPVWISSREGPRCLQEQICIGNILQRGYELSVILVTPVSLASGERPWGKCKLRRPLWRDNEKALTIGADSCTAFLDATCARKHSGASRLQCSYNQTQCEDYDDRGP